MCLTFLILLAILFQGSEQGVLIKSDSAHCTINPSFGNLTFGVDNGTHHAPINFWFYKNIPHFTVLSNVRSNETGKIVYKMNYNPCDKQAVNSMKRVVRLIYGENLQGRSSEDLIPSTWICPIKQGQLYYRGEKKSEKLNFLVPTFFGVEGTFHWHTIHKTSGKANEEIFLTTMQTYSVEFLHN